MAGARAQGGLCMSRSCSRSTRQCLCVDRVGASLQSSPAPPHWVCGDRKSLSLIPLREGRACWSHPKGGTRVLHVLSGQSQHGAHCCSQIRCRYVGSSVGGSELSSRQQYRFALGGV